MSVDTRFLAFDLGASGGRAIVGDVSPDRFRIEELHRFGNRPVEARGHLYWDFFALYAELLQGLRAYRDRYGPVLSGVGVDTWGCDFGLIDRNGELLRMPTHYRDVRTEGTVEIIEARFGKRELYLRTGIQFLVFNTLNQLIAMRRAGDPTLDAAAGLLFMPDMFHYCLTGARASEFTVASISQLYNPLEGGWDREICDSFGIPAGILQPLVRPGNTLGDLDPSISRETGVFGPVILPATHDTASAAAAVPSLEEGMAFISSGTWSVVGLELAAPVLGDRGFEMGFSNSGGAFGRTVYVKNVMGLWIIQRCRDAWALRGTALSFEDIAAAAARAKEPEVWIDPDDPRFLNPPDMVAEVVCAARESRAGAPGESDIGGVARLVFESLAWKYRYILESLYHATGAPIRAIHIVGGGANNALLDQLTADVTGREVLAGPTEATAIGNLAVQAVGAGVLESLAEARRLIGREFSMTAYRPRSDAGRETRYRQFLDASRLPTRT
jgi:rhamnulokinase